MTLPQIFPDWMPPWAQLALLVTALLFGLLFMLMPFSVFGVKGRMDMIEARLDEIQGEIRSLALRLPEPLSGRATDMDYRMGGPPSPEPPDPMPARPPIPPAPHYAPRRPPNPPQRGEAQRSEPRLY